MTIEQLRAAWRARPFRPFRIRMADGRQFDVPHPDFLSMSPTGRTVVIYETNEAFSIIDLLLMTEIEFEASSAAKT